MAVGSAGGHNDHMVPSDGFAARCGIVNKRVSSSSGFLDLTLEHPMYFLSTGEA